MADLLSVAMFKNIVTKSNVVKNSSAKVAYSTSNLNKKEEDMLVSILNKTQDLSTFVSSASKASTSSSTYSSGSIGKKVTLSEMIKPSGSSVKSASDVLTSMAKPNVSTPALGQKVDINSLIGGVKTPKGAVASYDAKKSTTVTLNELAAKCKKSADVPVETTTKVETGVKKSVIGNALGIDRLIPKVSLNSIGKNSFFK